MPNEFHMQIRVDVVTLANIVKGLSLTEGRRAYRTLNGLGQTVFKVAERRYLRELKEGEEIVGIDEALRFLEMEGILDRENSSVSQRALFNRRREESLKETQTDIEKHDKRSNRKEKTPEEIEREAMESPLVQQFLMEQKAAEERLKRENKEEKERLSKPTAEEMNRPYESPGLYPTPKNKEKKDEGA